MLEKALTEIATITLPAPCGMPLVSDRWEPPRSITL